MGEATRPIPIPDETTKTFWDGTVKHELLIPKCKDCGKFHFYPRPFCPHCFSNNLEYVKSSGKGKIYSYAVQQRPTVPGIDAPFVTALVTLDDAGVRLMTNIVGIDPDPQKVKVDMPVEVTWLDINEEVALPLFKPAS
ncbi:MAG: Zn-ribbon domain-containing OB-fold protein [Candidatus Tectomicrobia bacterium]|nr:Zn-ribbon domain-containing OB-fold protein [Candidatus Tectomicrobia bacterium]